MTELYRLHLVIPGLPKILANAKSQGWRARHFEKKKWRNIIMSYIDHSNRPLKPLERARLICTRFSSHPSDFGNRVDSFKAVIDGLVAAKVLIDDNDSVIVAQEYLWIKAGPKDGKISITVEEIVNLNISFPSVTNNEDLGDR